MRIDDRLDQEIEAPALRSLTDSPILRLALAEANGGPRRVRRSPSACSSTRSRRSEHIRSCLAGAFSLDLGLRGLTTSLFHLRAAQIVSVRLGGFPVRGSGLAERDGDRLFWILDFPAAGRRAKLAMLELVHDPFDRLLLRLGFASSHGPDPFSFEGRGQRPTAG